MKRRIKYKFMRVLVYLLMKTSKGKQITIAYSCDKFHTFNLVDENTPHWLARKNKVLLTAHNSMDLVRLK